VSELIEICSEPFGTSSGTSPPPESFAWHGGVGTGTEE
jgi:hypothetical protein